MSTSFDDKWIKFARDLVTTGEIDPMYVLMDACRRKYGNEWISNYALHFFMYYDAGQSAAVADAKTELDFWHMENYGYAGFKRGTERRHFRGEKGLTAMRTFQRMGSPIKIWQAMHRPTYHQMVENIRANFQGCQIGPYFAWKAMDILDRCLDMQVDLDLYEAVKYLPDEPKQCALSVWPKRSVMDTLVAVTNAISDLPAPGSPSRKCSYPEAETILCAINGALKGSYKFGQDLDRRYEELKESRLTFFLPTKLDWSKYVETLDSKTVPA